MDEKAQAVDRIVAAGEGDKVAIIIVCSRGTEIVSPDGLLIKCAICNESIMAFNASVAKLNEGAFLICKECFGELSPKLNQRGTPMLFKGRIRNNKFPDVD